MYQNKACLYCSTVLQHSTDRFKLYLFRELIIAEMKREIYRCLKMLT